MRSLCASIPVFSRRHPRVSDQLDNIYADPISALSAFRFDDDVVRVFPDMIQRSVPGYSTIIAMTGLLADKYASRGSNCYDLGCSLGASTLAMRTQIGDRDCRIVGVDNSEAMLKRCREIIDADTPGVEVELLCQDIQDTVIEDASVVVLNFTLQFIPPAERRAQIERIYQGLRPGGVLVLSEKVRFSDPHLDELNIELHHQFKRSNGYSDLEIAQKRSALEDVLIPETLETHRQRLEDAGFSSSDVWFQCFNFASMVALK